MGETQALIKVTRKLMAEHGIDCTILRHQPRPLPSNYPAFLKKLWKKDRLVHCSTNKTVQMSSHYPVVGQTAETEFEGLLSAGRRL